MARPLVLALATSATLLCAGAAHAGGNVFWSIGLNLPNVVTVVSNQPEPFYAPEPVYVPQRVYAPEPVYVPQRVYVPAPVYFEPPQVVYRPVPPAYYGPATIAYVRPMPGLVRPYPYWVKHHGHDRRDWRESRRDDRRDDRRDERRDRHDEYGDRFNR